MKHLNNYLQKGVVILIATMLLVIPNMNVYSSIGNYETSSSAIIANNDQEHPKKINDRPFFPAFALVGIIIGAVVAGSVGAVVGTELASEFGSSQPSYVVDENYVKYDFSQFDN